MDFSSLPDHVVLEIFRYLPFKDRVRSGRVNRTFRRMSNTAISRLTKSLDLWNYVWSDRFTPQSMSVLLNLCADRLEEIRFGFHHDHEIPFMRAFGQQFRCPNLTSLQCDEGDAAILRPILSNCPNLRTLDVERDIRFPADEIGTTSETLETLIIGRCDEDDLRSLIGRVPNLKHLKLGEREPGMIGSAARTLDRLLSTVPKLETLRMNGLAGELEEDFKHGCGRVGSFWRLKRLRLLKACDFYVDDNTSKKLAESFPEMRVLNVNASASSFTSAGLTWLSSLRELRKLDLYFEEFEDDEPRDLSAGVLSLANKCAQLRKLILGYSSVHLSPSVISQLLHSCRRLDLLALGDLALEPEPEPEPDRAAAAVMLPIVLFFVRSLVGLGARRIQIMFNNTEERKLIRDIWRSNAVEEALEKLKREEGTVVEINAPFDGDYGEEID